MKKIKLPHDKYALVDDEDYEYLNQWKWHLHKAGYVTRNYWVNKKCYEVKMHRLIMGLGEGDKREIDHIYGNRADNRKSELRVCTRNENARNRLQNKNTERPFKGVSWWEYYGRPGKWLAVIRHNNKSVHIGVFKTAKEAAIAYNEKATELFGEFARLNEV